MEITSYTDHEILILLYADVQNIKQSMDKRVDLMESRARAIEEDIESLKSSRSMVKGALAVLAILGIPGEYLIHKLMGSK